MKRKSKLTLFTTVLLFALFSCVAVALAAPVKKLLDRPLRVPHVSSACSAYFYAGEMLGAFEKNGLEIELIFSNFETIKEGLTSGKFDFTDGLLMKWLKPIEQGLDVQFTLGLHQGCVSSVVKADSPYKNLKDLKGKTIGVGRAIGDSPMNYFYRLALKEGLDPVKDFNYLAFDTGSLIAALDTGKADAVVGNDGNTYAKIKTGEFRYISRLATDKYFEGESCCLLVFSPKFVKAHPDVALKVTKILHELTSYVDKHREEVIRYAHAKGYINGTLEDNLAIVQLYKYEPGVQIGLKSFKNAFDDYQKSGIIDKDVDVNKVLERSFIVYEDPEIQ
jgi:NitT/TauT family transport system substrate-binding protein